LHSGTQGLLADYLEASGHAHEKTAALFRSIRNNRTGEPARTLSGDGIYKLVHRYAQNLGVTIGAHALRATAATNALEHEATSRRCRSGWVTPTSRPHVSMIGARIGRKIHRSSKSAINAIT
jgi:integrase